MGKKFSWEQPRSMTVVRIDNQGDRVLLYSNATPTNHDYYVIAGKDCAVKVGDAIQYEPYGANFGWLITESEE